MERGSLANITVSGHSMNNTRGFTGLKKMLTD
jgi:hypothetical protein